MTDPLPVSAAMAGHHAMRIACRGHACTAGKLAAILSVLSVTLSLVPLPAAWSWRIRHGRVP